MKRNKNDSLSSGSNNCSVVDCTNTRKKVKGREVVVHFYKFPSTKYESVRRPAWIRFCARKNLDGSVWLPSKNSFICSEHFVGGRHVNNPNHPSFIPTIRPGKPTNHVKTTDRFDRSLKRSKRKLDASKNEDVENDVGIEDEIEFSNRTDSSTNTDKCLVKDVSCGTGNVPTFFGFESVKRGNSLKVMTGINEQVFNQLLDILTKCDKPYKPRLYSIENMLLLFLYKLKSNSLFDELAVIFGMSTSTVSYNFMKILKFLHARTQQFVFWPSKEAIQATMPTCFKNKYPNCRVIIDFLEVEAEKPSLLDEQNSMYNSKKHEYTFKFLIGISPNGMITFLSKCYGGNTSDAFITNNSGFPSLLSPGDVVMSGKGFPAIKSVDKDINVISSKISTKKIESVIQRLQSYTILLNKMELGLLPYSDKIVHMCALLFNIYNQSPFTTH